jgi:hypothetical protein
MAKGLGQKAWQGSVGDPSVAKVNDPLSPFPDLLLVGHQ